MRGNVRISNENYELSVTSMNYHCNIRDVDNVHNGHDTMMWYYH